MAAREPAVKLEDPAEVKLEDPGDGVPVNLGGAVRKHWAARALTTYQEAANELPREIPRRFPDKAHAEMSIIAELDERLQIPVFKHHDRIAALSILCGDVLKELMTRGSISFVNAQDAREAYALKEGLVPVPGCPISSAATTEEEVQVLLETLTAVNKADWIKKFMASATVPRNQRPKKFASRGSARNHLVSKVVRKFNIFIPASDSGNSLFNSACDRALNALEKAGQFQWSAKNVRPQAPKLAISVAVKDTPEFRAGVDEARRSGHSAGFEAGRDAAYAEMNAQIRQRQQANPAGQDNNILGRTRQQTASMVSKRSASVEGREIEAEQPKKKRNCP